MPRAGDPKRRRRHFLKEWRKECGLTQEKLAELMDISKTTISNIENRKAGYHQDFLELAAEVMQPFTQERLDAATLISRPPPRPLIPSMPRQKKQRRGKGGRSR